MDSPHYHIAENFFLTMTQWHCKEDGGLKRNSLKAKHEMTSGVSFTNQEDCVDHTVGNDIVKYVPLYSNSETDNELKSYMQKQWVEKNIYPICKAARELKPTSKCSYMKQQKFKKKEGKKYLVYNIYACIFQNICFELTSSFVVISEVDR